MNEQLAYVFQEYAHKRDSTGTITTVIAFTLQDISTRIEFPYNVAVETLKPGDIVTATDTPSGMQFDIPSNGETYIGKSLVCPFCGTTLINLEEHNQSHKHCFNVGCHNSVFGKIYNLFSLFNNGKSDALLISDSINVTYTELLNKLLTEQRQTYGIHVNNIIATLYGRCVSDANVSPDMKQLLLIFNTFIKGCGLSTFLKMLNTPLKYYEDLEILDNEYPSIESFVEAMQNHRSISTMMNHNKDLIDLLYVSFHINDLFIREFLTIRATNKYMLT